MKSINTGIRWIEPRIEYANIGNGSFGCGIQCDFDGIICANGGTVNTRNVIEF